MLEQIQGIMRASLAYQGHLERHAADERKLISGSHETLAEAYIVCADGFSVPVAVNKQNWGNAGLTIPGQIEVLHEMFHQAAGHEKCTGTIFSFVSPL